MFNTTQRLSWFSSLATAIVLGFMALLSGCGGGGASSTTSAAPDPLVVSPSNAVAYNGNPVTLHITGGVQPYNVSSSDTSIINIPYEVPSNSVVINAANVPTDTPVTLTLRDSKGTTVTATITVKPSIISNTLTVKPDPDGKCGTSICSGQIGTASVQLINFGTPQPYKSVRFDVVQGDYQFITDTAGTLASTFTATTGQDGFAYARVKANSSAHSQYAILKVTEEGGNFLQTTFTIVQYIDGSKILSVVPSTQTITTYYKGDCSSGVKLDFIIHGGTAPYRVTSTMTNVATVSPSTVLTDGAGFTATTHGWCSDTGAVIDIMDANGLVTTATVINKEGSNTVAPPPTVALAVTAVATVATGSTLSVPVTGGTAPYYVSSADLTKVTASVAGSTITLTGVAAGTANVTVSDSVGATKTIAVTVTP